MLSSHLSNINLIRNSPLKALWRSTMSLVESQFRSGCQKGRKRLWSEMRSTGRPDCQSWRIWRVMMIFLTQDGHFRTPHAAACSWAQLWLLYTTCVPSKLIMSSYCVRLDFLTFIRLQQALCTIKKLLRRIQWLHICNYRKAFWLQEEEYLPSMSMT